MTSFTLSGRRDTDDEVRFVVGADGSVEEANDVALRLLGVSLDELRRAPRGAFAVSQDEDEQAALRRVWMDGLATAAVGVSAIRRADGEIVRVRYVVGLQEDGRYLVGLRPVGEETVSPTVFASAGAALAAWRAAERRLEVLQPGTPE